MTLTFHQHRLRITGRLWNRLLGCRYCHLKITYWPDIRRKDADWLVSELRFTGPPEWKVFFWRGQGLRVVLDHWDLKWRVFRLECLQLEPSNDRQKLLDGINASIAENLQRMIDET